MSRAFGSVVVFAAVAMMHPALAAQKCKPHVLTTAEKNLQQLLIDYPAPNAVQHYKMVNGKAVNLPLTPPKFDCADGPKSRTR